MKKSNDSKMPAELIEFMDEQKRSYADGSMSKEHADLLDERIPDWNLEPNVGVRINVLREAWLANGWTGDERICTAGFESARELKLEVGVMEYAAAVSFLFQDRGVWRGIEQVGQNHESTVAAFELGVEPFELVEWALPNVKSKCVV